MGMMTPQNLKSQSALLEESLTWSSLFPSTPSLIERERERERDLGNIYIIESSRRIYII